MTAPTNVIDGSASDVKLSAGGLLERSIIRLIYHYCAKLLAPGVSLDRLEWSRSVDRKTKIKQKTIDDQDLVAFIVHKL